MTENKPILNIIQNLLQLHKKDESHFQEVSNIFMSLSEICSDELIRSFCIDASVVIGEAIYGKSVTMSFGGLEEEFKKLGR